MSKQILAEEEQLAHDSDVREAREKQLADSIAKLPKGFRFKEERGVDPGNPPVVIDIEANFNNVKEVNISDYISDFNWVVLDMPPGSEAYSFSYCTPFIGKNNIVLSGSHFLLNYSRSGEFKEEVCVREPSAPDNYKGPFGKAHIFNNKLYYRFADNIEKKYYWMQYDLSSENSQVQMPSTAENYQLSGKGKIIMALPIEKKSRFNDYVPVSPNLWVGIKNKWQSADHDPMLVSLSNTNDTLATFQDYDKVKNFSHTIFRGDFPQISYQYRSVFTFSNSFNDTIFRMVPPNKIVPAFIVKLGAKNKLTAQEGFTPGVDISDKVCVYDWRETSKRIYMILRKGYGKNEMQIFHAVYDKKTKDFYRLSANSISGKEEGEKQASLLMEVKRDIPGVLPYWPEDISNEGEICYILSVRSLKNMIHSQQFLTLNLLKERTAQLENRIDNLPDEQIIILLIQEK